MPESLNILLVQPDLTWEKKSRNRDDLAKVIAKKDAGLIIFPEMFTTGFTMNAAAMAEGMDGESVTWMKQLAKDKNCAVCGSLIIKENGKYFNRLIWAEPGRLYHYDKRHLFSLAREEKTYSPGNERLIIEYKGWKIFPLICYDLRFPVWSRRTKTNEYDLLIYVANWPERRSHAWKQLLIARAIENQCYVAGVNRVGNDGHNVFHSGDSAVVDFKGEMLMDFNPGKEDAKTLTISLEPLREFRANYAFGDDADRFEIIP